MLSNLQVNLILNAILLVLSFSAVVTGVISIKQFFNKSLLKIRGVGLFAFAVALNFLFDLVKSIDGLASASLTDTDRVSCGLWELFYSIFGVVSIVLLFLHASKAFLMLNRFNLASSVQPLPTPTSKSVTSSGSSLKNLKTSKVLTDAELINRLVHTNKKRNRAMMFSVSILLVFGFYSFSWVVSNTLPTASQSCFKSWPYWTFVVVQLILCVPCLKLVSLLQDFDDYGIKFDLFSIFGLWVTYLVVASSLQLSNSFSKSADLGIWISFRLVYYFIFYFKLVAFKGMSRNETESKIELQSVGTGKIDRQKLLQTILNDSVLSKAFHAFAKSEFCSEYLAFIKEVEEFNKLLEQYLEAAILESSSDKPDHSAPLEAEAKKKAKAIVENYLKPKSVHELNISSKTKVALCETVEKETFDRSLLFKEAIREVMIYLSGQILLRFLKTETGKTLLNERISLQDSVTVPSPRSARSRRLSLMTQDSKASI